VFVNNRRKPAAIWSGLTVQSCEVRWTCPFSDGIQNFKVLDWPTSTLCPLGRRDAFRQLPRGCSFHFLGVRPSGPGREATHTDELMAIHAFTTGVGRLYIGKNDQPAGTGQERGFVCMRYRAVYFAICSRALRRRLAQAQRCNRGGVDDRKGRHDDDVSGCRLFALRCCL
jgi:hypothetical protein